MTVRITSRPRIGDVIKRIWPGQVIGDSVCMQPPILSTFSFESGFHFDSRAESLPSRGCPPAPARPLRLRLRNQPGMPEAAHLADDREQRPPLVGQLVVDARRRLRITAPDHDAL